MTVRVVVFDAGLTLLRATPSFWEAFVEGVEAAGARLPPHREPAEHRRVTQGLWEEHEQRWRDSDRPSPHVGDEEAARAYWSGLYRLLLERLDVEGDREVIAAQVADHFASPGVFRPFPDVRGTLRDLAGRGLRLGLLSNWSPSLRGILAAEDLLDHFETAVISGEIGVAKPSLTIYERLLDELGETPGPHVAYVGDSIRDDVRPSRRLGLTAVLIDRYGRHPDHGGNRVTELAELDGVLDLPRPGA